MLELNEFRSLASADRHSSEVVEQLRVELNNTGILVPQYIDVIVVGSYGRGEAVKDVSDFEWITIFDDLRVSREEASLAQAQLTKLFAAKLGRDTLSISKTFGEVAAHSSLLTNVGGEADTNQTLTYRMLTLAEGRTLTQDAHDAVVRGLAQTYGRTHTAGHRLLSLATEIARYWRTLRIDYKHKVDETGKSWALRSTKLRSFRRFWYFSSALHFVASGPRVAPPGRLNAAEVEAFMKTMGGNPAVRFINAAPKLAIDESLARQLLRSYDEVHLQTSDPKVRTVLNRLDAADMETEAVFVDIREKTRKMHHLMAEIVLKLEKNKLIEMLEMFLL